MSTQHQANPEVMSPGRAAAALGISIETLRRWEKAGKIAAFRTPGGQRRFDRSEIDRVRLRGVRPRTP